MTDYNAQLIDLLNEKIFRLEKSKDDMRKENNRLKKRVKELEKAINADVNNTESTLSAE